MRVAAIVGQTVRPGCVCPPDILEGVAAAKFEPATVGEADVAAEARHLRLTFRHTGLSGVDVVGLPGQIYARRGEEAAPADATKIFTFDIGQPAKVDLGTELRTVTAQILIHQDGVDGCSGNASGLGGDIKTEVEERWTGLLVGNADQEDGAG